jgi:hypothetical protein
MFTFLFNKKYPPINSKLREYINESNKKFFNNHIQNNIFSNCIKNKFLLKNSFDNKSDLESDNNNNNVSHQEDDDYYFGDLDEKDYDYNLNKYDKNLKEYNKNIQKYNDDIDNQKHKIIIILHSLGITITVFAFYFIFYNKI